MRNFMNKIFKVIYSKTKRCYVVVSELTKSHCKSTQCNTAKSKTALTAAILLVLGTSTFTAVPTVQATDSLFSNDYVGTNYKKDDGSSYSAKETKNYHGAGAEGVGSNTLGMNAIAGENTITIGDRDASAATESVYIGAKYDANNQVHPSSGHNVVSVGYGSDAAGTGSIAIGSGAAADTFDNAGSGTNPDKASQSIAIGNNAQAKQNNIAIGAGSVATATASTADAYLTGQAAVSSYVSVGGGTVTTTDSKTQETTTTTTLRRITNVADGATASDVATVGQLQALSDKVGVYDAGFGIEIDSDKDNKTNTISLNRNLGKDYNTTDDVNLKNDAAGTSLILGGRVEKGSPTGGQSVTGDYGALGRDSVTVGGVDNTVETSGDAAVVVGGIYNKAAGTTSAVVGGSANDAIGNESAIFGGNDNNAYETYATISGGSWNKAYGNASSIFGGSVNDVSGRSSVAVGGHGSHVYGDVSVGIAGGSTNADYALAAGNEATVTVQNGTAIGYQATANKEGTVAFGHDNGDVYYTSTWPQKATEKDGKYYDAQNKEITKDQYEALRNADLTFNDYSQKPTVTENKYDAAGYNRLVKVADGVDDHDVVVMEQLKNAKNDLKVNAGWGINVADVTTKNDDDTETTTKNVISLNRNLGTNLDKTGHVYLDVSKTGLVLGTVVDGAQGTDTDLHYGATGDYAVTVGGGVNTASGKASVVLGGSLNKASNEATVASGGYSNVASGSMAAVYGGSYNEASGADATILGGELNKASNTWTAVGGGASNEASGIYASVWGGSGNKATDNSAAVYGGSGNSAYGLYSAILGGGSNKAGAAAVVSGGASNEAAGLYSAVLGGEGNIVTGANATAVGGVKGSVNGVASVGILGGSTGINAPLTLAAGYQSTVTDTGVTSTPITEEEAEKFQEEGTHPGLLVGSNDPDNLSFKILDHFATAVGYQATADEAQTVAFGHDKGDTYYGTTTYTWKQKATVKDGHYYDEYNQEIDKESYESLKNADGTWNDYTQPIATVEEKKYDSAYYNRLVKVADGIDDHDVVVMEQLKQYAEKDASNLGSNIKVYKTDENGNVQLDNNKMPIEDKDATTTAQNANKDAWGRALGADPFTAGTATTATNASTSDQLVTGKTLYNYDAPVAETGKKLNYVSANNTTGQNLSALDAQVADNASKLNDKTHNIKYYSVNEEAPLMNLDTYKNDGNDGAKGMGSLAAGFVTHADGIASTVAGSYSGVINQNGNGLDFRGAAALSYGTFNVNQNTDGAKTYSGVANSIVGQANMTTDSNAAIIYGAGNTVTNSYRPIDNDKAKAILDNVSNPTNLSKAMQDAVKESGGQVMVMGGGNTVDKAYMTQVSGVGNTVTGADSTYAEGTSTQYNFVDGFQNGLTNGKHDYIIGSNNKVSGESIDKNQSNIVFGDNHKLTNQKNNVIIGSSDTADDETTASDVVAIGHNAKVSAEGGVAIGSGSEATVTGKSTEGYDPTTGQNSTETTAIWQATNAAVSIGKADGTVTRQINGVAAGTNETDAVNVAQLKSLQSGLTNDLTDKGLKFAANSGAEYTAKLGSTVKIQGTEKKEGHEYTADNLTTEIDEKGNITILMDKDMSVEKLAVNGKDGKEGAPGTPGSIGISGQDGQSSVGIDGKDGISIKGNDGKDGVTMKAVDGENGTEGHIGLTGPAGTNGINGADGKPGTSIDITVKNGYDGANGVNGKNGVDGTSLTRIVYKDGAGEHQVAAMEDGLKFKGDDGTEIAKKLNNTMEIIGGADSTKLTDKNIGVNSDGDKLKVQLSKDLTGMNSTTYTTTTGEGESATTSTTVVNGNGLTITDGPSITNKGIDGGNKVITKVGSGIEKDATGNITEASKTNAANIGDVQTIAESTATSLTDTGLKFAANSGAEYTAKLGSTVKIQGTAKKENHEYTADNLTTEIDEKGNITILMDKDMSVEKLAVNGKNGKDSAPGTPGSIGISGQDGQSGVGIDGKDGISIKGKDGKDGVTMKAVDGKDGTEGHIGLTGPAGTNGIKGADGQTGTSIDITVKNGYDGANGVNGKNGVDGTSLTRIVYKDGAGEHQVATMEDGLKFKGDDGTEIAKKLNNTLDIIGGANGDLTEGNIGVNSTDKGQLKVQLAKDLKGITSIGNQTTTKVDGKDVTTGAKITLGADGTTTISGGDVNVSGNKITHVGSGIEKDANGKYTVTDQNKGNAANIGDVQNMVNDAKTELISGDNGLNNKANIDASNIGANLKGEDGKTPASDDEKTTNENAWGKAIGTGKIEANNGQLVTGDTVYNEVRPKEDGNYVKTNQTTGANLSALDSKIGKLDDDGNYIKKDDSISKNLSTLDAQVKTNADNIANNTKSIQNITNSVKNLSDNAVQYDKDSNKTKVTLGGEGGTTITNVKDGALSEKSSDAVNGKQLYNEQKAREAADKDITEKVTNNTNEITKIKNGDFTDASKTAIHNIAKDAVKVVDGKNTTVTKVDGTDTTPTTYAVNVEGTGKVASGDTGLISGDTLYKEVHVDSDGSYIKSNNTVGQNLSALDSGLKTTSDLIHTNAKGDTIQIGGNSTATKIDVSGKDKDGNTTGRVITGVMTDGKDLTSAANVGYVNGITSANTQQIYRDMNNAYSRLDTNINRAAAGSNALAALHPLDFDPADKASFAVGYGHYHNANAAAVGAFYQPNANTMVNMGISIGNGDPGFNAGVSFKIGKGSAYNGVSKAEMAQTIHDQAEEISAIKANDAAKDKRIDALEKENQEMKKQIQEILSRLNG